MGISVEPEDLNDPAYLRGLEAGQKIAEARIIKTLEKLIPKKRIFRMPMEYWVQRKLVEQVIALIKGENK